MTASSRKSVRNRTELVVYTILYIVLYTILYTIHAHSAEGKKQNELVVSDIVAFEVGEEDDQGVHAGILVSTAQ